MSLRRLNPYSHLLTTRLEVRAEARTGTRASADGSRASAGLDEPAAPRSSFDCACSDSPRSRSPSSRAAPPEKDRNPRGSRRAARTPPRGRPASRRAAGRRHPDRPRRRHRIAGTRHRAMQTARAQSEATDETERVYGDRPSRTLTDDRRYAPTIRSISPKSPIHIPGIGLSTSAKYAVAARYRRGDQLQRFQVPILNR